MVGPWQVPVADCAVTLADYKGFAGEAMSMGERTPLAALDAPASGRMAVAEAITNLLAAPIELLARQAVGQLDGRLRRAGRGRGAVRDRARGRAWNCARRWAFHPRRQGQPVDAHAVGTAAAKEEGDLAREPDRHAPSPRWPTCAARSRRNCGQRGHDAGADGPGQGRSRMGGSILAQALGQPGDAVPDLDDRQDW